MCRKEACDEFVVTCKWHLLTFTLRARRRRPPYISIFSSMVLVAGGLRGLSRDRGCICAANGGTIGGERVMSGHSARQAFSFPPTQPHWEFRMGQQGPTESNGGIAAANTRASLCNYILHANTYTPADHSLKAHGAGATAAKKGSCHYSYKVPSCGNWARDGDKTHLMIPSLSSPTS